MSVSVCVRKEEIGSASNDSLNVSSANRSEICRTLCLALEVYFVFKASAISNKPRFLNQALNTRLDTFLT